MELDGLRTLHLFAGAGGGILGDILLGHRPICAVEIEKFPRSILQQRQEDGHLPRFPIWDDINTFDGKPWRGLVDCVSGGFPCQDISAAGRGAGLAGARSGLWFEMLRVIDEVRPRFVFIENSPSLRVRGLGTVIQGLTDLGYDVRWCVLGAGDIGFNIERRRLWLVAIPRADKTNGKERLGCIEDGSAQIRPRHSAELLRVGVQTVERLYRRPDGVARRLDRVSASGNGQVPLVAATAWRLLTQEL